MWSEEHFEVMRPLMKMLADAGQKVITATLNRDPWRYQCFDDYEPMIFWSRYDNEWKYDYTIFDKWIEFMMEIGIDKQINCYSMLPWGDCSVDYKDMRTGKDGRNVRVSAIPGTPEFEEMWVPFLIDFTAHLREKGWLEKTNMAIDERAPKDIDEAARLLKKYAPEIGFAMADNHDSYKRYAGMMRDVCVGQRHSLMQPEEIVARRAKGEVSTFYVCCSTLFPNAFTNSQPFESELLCVYGISHDYDGMLRWAYNSWPARPEYDSRFRKWASGDTFIVYPGARSSVRFERLIDGVEFSEKVRTLRAKYADKAEVLQPLEAKLAELHALNINDASLDWRGYLVEVNTTLNEVAKQLAK
jgi:hypothetical protein